MTLWIASFDIGKKNFAFCVEEVDSLQFQHLSNPPKSKRYNTDGTATRTFEETLYGVVRTGKLVLIRNHDLTDGCSAKLTLDPRSLVNMTSCLDKYTEYWDKCSAFVIEQQMGFGKKRNAMAIRLGHHCYSYFLFRYSTFKHIVEFPAYHKTKLLGAPPKLSKYQRKKWAVEHCRRLLEHRNDVLGLDEISHHKKKDDVSDIVLQLQCYKYFRFVENVY